MRWREPFGPSGETVPRFASLKSDLVNVRRGPARTHKNIMGV